ncbi:MAG TPA: hypothetical protein VK192_00610, partial [Sphingomicrobium sp.]|nr:hypothetical protein [Sphingomicrobium sp.]
HLFWQIGTCVPSPPALCYRYDRAHDFIEEPLWASCCRHSTGNASYRAGAAIALAAAFLLVWINLAVGIIGNENNPLNLMFFGVIGAALVASIIARFKAAGMARAMTIAAAIQGLIGIGTFILGLGAAEPPDALGLLGLIEFFAPMGLLSAWCFRRAARA